jgi:hypothetical protein
MEALTCDDEVCAEQRSKNIERLNAVLEYPHGNPASVRLAKIVYLVRDN